MSSRNAWNAAPVIDGVACRIQPTGTRIVVAPDQKPDTTPGGIALPQTNEPASTGIVVARGPKAGFAFGARVIFARYAGAPIELDGRWWIVLGVDDVLGTLADRPDPAKDAARRVIDRLGPDAAAAMTEAELATMVEAELAQAQAAPKVARVRLAAAPRRR